MFAVRCLRDKGACDEWLNCEVVAIVTADGGVSRANREQLFEAKIEELQSFLD